MDRPIRIAYVLEATSGGTRRHLNDLLMGLDPDRFCLHAVVWGAREPECASDFEKWRQGGVAVHSIEMVRGISLWKDHVSIQALARLFRRLQPDIVHAHGSKGGYLGRRAAARAGVKIAVHTAHVYPFQWIGCESAWLYRRVRIVNPS